MACSLRLAVVRLYWSAAGIWLVLTAACGTILALDSADSPYVPLGEELRPLYAGMALFGLLGNLIFGLWFEMMPRLTAHPT